MSWADASRSFFNGLFTEMNAPAQSRVSSLGYDIVTDVTKRKQALSKFLSSKCGSHGNGRPSPIPVLEGINSYAFRGA